jgi:hypothetical protein
MGLMDYIPGLPHIPLPDIELPHIPNPFQSSGPQMPEHGPANPPAVAPGADGHPSQSIHDRYQAQAYGTLGMTPQQFGSMDPVERNTRINAAYSQMYMDNPDVMKWAGMASYASETVGVGMMQAGALNIPGVQGLTGAPDGDRLGQLFAQGNGELFQDIYWQHLAFQHGGVDELRRAAKEDPSSIDPRQIAAWAQMDEGQKALHMAQASGDQAAIKAAQDRIWAGNGNLLEFEQKEFLRRHVYEAAPDARDAVGFLSGPWNMLGVNSPIPGGEEFHDYRDRTGATGQADVGDTEQRWDWISNSMLPSFRDRETNHNPEMMQDMRRMVANRNTGIPGLPVNTEDPLDSPTHMPSWMPSGLHLPSLSDIPKMLPSLPSLPSLSDVRDAIPSLSDVRDALPSLPSMHDVREALPSIPSLSDVRDALPSLPSMSDVRHALPSLSNPFSGLF